MGKRSVITAVLAAALLTVWVRPVQAGPPKLEISNTTVLITSSVLGVALAVTAIVNHVRGGKKEAEVVKKDEKKEEEKVYEVKSKEQLKSELKQFRRTPANLDSGDPGYDKPENRDADESYDDSYDSTY